MNQQLQKNLTGLLQIQYGNEWTQPEWGWLLEEREGKEPFNIKDYFWSSLVSGWNNNKIVLKQILI